VVETKEDPFVINGRLLGEKIVGGLPLKKFYPELGNAALWCCTELTTKGAIDAAAGLVGGGEAPKRAAREEAGVVEVAR
jgi:glycine dehydrogenase subunit 1